jgi:hypothetical protein
MGIWSLVSLKLVLGRFEERGLISSFSACIESLL